MRTFQQYPLVNYIGQPFTKPISVFGVNGQSIPLTFNWLSYGVSTTAPNLVVKVDMGTSLVAQKINTLRSVYIDNTGSDVPIYVIFPDTGCVVVCQPNCTIWAPCYTGGMIALVAGLGFFTGDIPSTAITFTNLIVPPATNIEIQTAVALWKASNTITRGTTIYNTNTGVPSLGDQFTTQNLNMNAAGTQTVFNLGTGFIYLKNVSVTLTQVLAAGAGGSNINLFFESTGVSGVFFQYNILMAANATVAIATLINQVGDFKLDGSQLWRLRIALVAAGFSTGVYTANFSFTTNPL